MLSQIKEAKHQPKSPSLQIDASSVQIQTIMQSNSGDSNAPLFDSEKESHKDYGQEKVFTGRSSQEGATENAKFDGDA